MASKEVGSLHVTISADTTKLQKGLNDAKGALKGAANSFKSDAQKMGTGTFDNLNKSAKGFKDSMTDLVNPIDNVMAGLAKFGMITGVITSVTLALKGLWTAGAEGAQMEYTLSKFDRLTASIGGVSDVIMHDLKVATRGMLSDMQLAASATDLLSLGLVKTSDDLVRMVKVASQLNMPMNQLVLALTNQTTMRFDQLNVKVAGFEERLQRLKDTGMETQAAFTEAFLQQAEQQLIDVGGAAETSAGKIAKMDAAILTLKDSWKLFLSGPVGDTANVIANALNPELLNNEIEAIGKMGLAWDDYIQKVNEAILASGKAPFMQVPTVPGDPTKPYEQVIDNTNAFTRAEYEARQAMLQGAAAAEILRKAISKLSPELQEAWGEYEGQIADSARWTAIAAGQTKKLGKNIEGVGEAAAEAKEPVQSVFGLMDNAIASPIAAFIQDLQWLQAGGWRINAAFEAVKQGVLAGKISPADAEAFTKELFIQATDLQLELDQIDAKTAATNIATTLGISLTEARGLLSGTGSIQDILTQLSQTEWHIKIIFDYINPPTDFPAPTGTGAGAHGSGGHEPTEDEGGDWHGASFTVPPGFSNDSFPLWVQSGEHVKVTPAGQTPSSSAPAINVTVNPSQGMDEAAVAQIVINSINRGMRQSMQTGVRY